MNKGVKQNLSRYLLYRELRQTKRTGEVVPYVKANAIGILYDATKEQDYELVKQYVKDIRSHSKEVIALGYYDTKQLPDTRYMKLGLDFFTRKALNWKMKPSNPIVNNFINKNFDILISLNLNQSIPLRYVSALTRARFKIGKYEEGMPHIYDFEIKTAGPQSLKSFIAQVNHYLNIIKNDQPQEV